MLEDLERIELGKFVFTVTINVIKKLHVTIEIRLFRFHLMKNVFGKITTKFPHGLL